MSYLIAAHTDIGKRSMNQDAFCVKTAETLEGEVVFAALCDGMGGADDGDKASEETILGLENWFEQELPKILKNGADICQLHRSLEEVLNQQNDNLIQYGNSHGRKLGTTATALLLYRGECAVVHVGDSRIYQINKEGASQLTEDHSLVAKEVREGKITPEMARKDKRRNVLTQCVGIRGGISPQFLNFPQQQKTSFLLCSDGFVHENEIADIGEKLAPDKIKNEKKMKQGLVELTEHAKKSGESDNITTVLVQIK
mgnify:CR=1 FL=1